MGGLGRALDGRTMSTDTTVGIMHGRGMGMGGSSTGMNGAGGAGGGTGQVNRAVTPPPDFSVDRTAATGPNSISRAAVTPPPFFPVERRQQQGSVSGWSQLQHCVIGMALYLCACHGLLQGQSLACSLQAAITASGCGNKPETVPASVGT